MKRTLGFILAGGFLVWGAHSFAQSLSEGPEMDSYYHLGPDSLPQDGVPKGEIRGPFTLPAKLIPARSILIGFTFRRSTTRPMPAA